MLVEFVARRNGSRVGNSSEWVGLSDDLLWHHLLWILLRWILLRWVLTLGIALTHCGLINSEREVEVKI